MKKIESIKASYLMAISVIFIGATSFSVMAQVNPNAPLETFTESLSAFGTIVNTATIIVVALAFLYFFYNLANYILKENDRGESKQKMGYAIIAMVLITSLWGIIAFVRNVVGIDAGDANNIQTPGVEIGNN